MMIKRWMAAGLAAAMLLGMTACGSGRYDSAMNTIQMANGAAYSEKGGASLPMMPVQESAAMDAYEYELADSNPGTYGENPQIINDNSAYYAARKLIKNVNLNVETKEFEQMMAALEARVEELGGYIENVNTYNGSRYSNREPIRNANLTARIPKEQLSAFLATVSEIGNVTNRSESVQDVTLAYVDIESHKDALSIEQERLLALLERAESIEDIITIEDRLSYVRYQLESMESQLRTYDNKVDFSTVYLNIQEVKELTPVEEETIWERIANGFMDNLQDVGEGLLDFAIWFIVHIPNLAVFAVVVVLIVWIIKLLIRRHKKKKAAKAAKKEQQNAEQQNTDKKQ